MRKIGSLGLMSQACNPICWLRAKYGELLRLMTDLKSLILWDNKND
ncbi:hypothetical protein ES703_38729 [subsurface metagenome]